MNKKRFLIINPYGIGDVLFTVPMIKNLKANVPDAFIGYVANRRTAGLLQNLSEIDRVTIYDRDEFKTVWDRSYLGYFKLLNNTLSEIRDPKYDICFDLSMTGYASFYCLLAGIPERVGLNFRDRSPFLTRKIPFNGYEGRHVAEYYLDLLRETGFSVRPYSMEVPVAAMDEDWAARFLKETGVTANRVAAVVPGGGESWGAEARYKRWPVEKYAKLVRRMIEHFNLQVVLLGNAKEESLCKELAGLVKYPVFSASGATTLGQTMAILKKCNFAVVNDGGPLHMAVAAGTRTVSIFGPVDENVYGPYPANGHKVVTHSIACRPCYRKFRRAACEHISCLSGVEVEDVFQRVKEILS